MDIIQVNNNTKWCNIFKSGWAEKCQKIPCVSIVNSVCTSHVSRDMLFDVDISMALVLKFFKEINRYNTQVLKDKYFFLKEFLFNFFRTLKHL